MGRKEWKEGQEWWMEEWNGQMDGINGQGMDSRVSGARARAEWTGPLQGKVGRGWEGRCAATPSPGGGFRGRISPGAGHLVSIAVAVGHGPHAGYIPFHWLSQAKPLL